MNTLLAIIILLLLTILVITIRTFFYFKEFKERWLVISRNITDGLVVIQNNSVKDINSVFTEITGYKAKEIKGKNILNYIAKKDRERVAKEYKKQDTFSLYDVAIIDKRERHIPIELKVRKVWYKGRPSYLLIITNIRVQKGLEEVLQRQEKRFEALSENIPDIIARLDSEGRFVYVNNATKEEFEMSDKDFFWKSVQELQIEGLEYLKKGIEKVVSSGEVEDFYNKKNSSSGMKYFHSKIIPEFDESNKIRSVIFISRDISELKEVDEIKTKFITLSTHQLRSPLSSISWCVSSLIREDLGKINKGQRKYLEDIQESTRTLVKVTDAFLNVTMIDLGIFILKPKPIEVISLTEKIINEFKKEIKEKEIKIKKNYQNKLHLNADSKVIKTALKGILSNAVKYTDREGRIEITWEKDNEKVLLEITDNGWGIPETEKKYIFSKFYRAKNVRKKEVFGTGLDLYIIKSLVEKAGGEISFHSPVYEKSGTSFKVKLPIKDE